VGSLKLVQGGWRETGNEEVLRYSLCDSHLKQISGSVLLSKPGVYKVIWHNSYSYMKAKTLKYRLRILKKKDAIEERMHHDKENMKLDDLFIVSDISQLEESTYKCLKSIYPNFIPIVRI
jgi:predicted transcriptional regulator